MSPYTWQASTHASLKDDAGLLGGSMAGRTGTRVGSVQANFLRAVVDVSGADSATEEIEDDILQDLGSDNGIRRGIRPRRKRTAKAAPNGSKAEVTFAKSDFDDLRDTVQQLSAQMSTIAVSLHQVLEGARMGGMPIGLDVPMPMPMPMPFMDISEKPALNKKPKKEKTTPDIVYSAEVYPHDASGSAQTRSPKSIKSALPLRDRQGRKQEKLTKMLTDAYAAGDLPVFEVQKYVSGAKPGRFGPRNKVVRETSWSMSDSSQSEPIRYASSYDDLYAPPRYGKPTTVLEGSFEIVQEAGVLLRIYSPHLIRAIEAVAGHYPGVARDSQFLVVPEPFCALLHFRDQLVHREPVDVATRANVKKPTHTYDTDAEDSDVDESSEDEIQRQEDAFSHIKMLYSFLDAQFLSAMSREKQRWQAETPMCTFEWLWLLFPPDELVYEASSANKIEMQAYQVKSFSLEGPFRYDDDDKPIVNQRRLRRSDGVATGHSIKRMNIRVTYRTHDGRKAILKTKLFVVNPFKGEKRICDLEIYPARFLEDSDGSVRARLIQRGRRYQTLANRGQFDYHGDTFSGVRRRLDARIIVDLERWYYGQKEPNHQEPARPNRYTTYDRYATYPDPYDDRSPEDSDDSQYNGGYRRPPRPDRWRGKAPKSFQSTSKSKKFDLSATEELPDEQYIICSPTMKAYVLQERLWEVLAVECISDCVYNERLLDELQISIEARRLIQALSRSYALNPNKSKTPGIAKDDHQGPWSSDFIPNKGGGQIILLHGKPGVGKTSTAECIAELSHRPLLTITCGDLGSYADTIQTELDHWLHLGRLWNGVLVFDEADVFLESRTHGDIQRNSIVSVFLRAIEYHSGLMFLTTNRIGSFDEAVLSRMHAVLHLPNLTAQNRREIWDTSFRKLADERPSIKVDFAVMNYAYNDETILKLNWNGREIRNAFNTMIALAEWDAQNNDKYTKDGKVLVTRQHLEEVATMSGTFKDYLEELRGMTDDDHMKSQGIRGR